MLRVRTVFTGVAGSPWYNNLYLNGSIQAEAEEAVDQVRQFWDSVKGYISTGITIKVDDDVPNINPADGTVESIYSVSSASLAGGNAADPLPRMTQMLVRLRTSGVVAGRRVQGRTFLPGFGEGSSTNGRPNPSDVTLIQNAFIAMVAGLDAGDVALGVWSRPVEDGRAGSLHLVKNVSVWSEWSVLRSRRD